MKASRDPIGRFPFRRWLRAARPMGLAVALLVASPPVSTRPARAETPVSSAKPARLLKQLSLDQLFDLEVTSVSQKPESLSQTPAAIHVVTQNDLRQMGALSIPEALRNIPGLEVARIDARQYAISARGFNGAVANKLLVLMDGRSVYTPLYSGVFWDAQDAFMEDIEQIEVIRGPGATVWGANAVNGVINIRSKLAAQTQGWLVSGGGGSSERGFGGARFGGRFGLHTSYRVYGKQYDRAASIRTNGNQAGDATRGTQGGFRLDWDSEGRDRLTLQGDGTSGAGDQPAAAAVEYWGENALGAWTRAFSATSDLEIRGYYDHTDRQLPKVFGERLDTYDLALRHRFAFGRGQDVVWGLGYRRLDDDVQNSAGVAFLPARVTHQLFSCFLQDEVSMMADRLRLTLGSKFERNDYTGFEVQPSVRLAWMPVSTQTVWAAASRAVRTPSRIDRDFFIPAAPPYFLAGSPNFESEVLRAGELGYKVNPTAAVTGSVETFYNVYDHLRSLEAGAPLQLGNGLKAHTYGVEAEASYQVSSPWRLSAGYSYLKMKVEAEPASTDMTGSRQEGDSPQHQSFMRSSWSAPHDVDADFSVRYVSNLSNQKVPAYATGDARLGWQKADRLELELVGKDLFAPRHSEFGTPASRREIARAFYGRATCHF